MPGKWLSKMCLASREIFFVAAPREETLSLASTHQTAGENNDKSRNSQVLTKILNYELIQKNQGCIIGSLLKVLRHCVRFFRAHTVSWQY